jgi:hypothetical protein
MFTFKNVFAVGLFLFGTTFVWMTASFAGRTPPPTGAAWAVVNALTLLVVVGFTVAAWGVFKGASWWETVALASAVVGLVSMIPYLVGLTQIDATFADLGIEINLWMHILGSLIVVGLVLLPSMHDWMAPRF